VETEILSPERRESYLRLLDDPSPAVRNALLSHFTELGAPAHEFLRSTQQQSHRALAKHAAWFLGKLNFSDPAAEFRAFINSLNYELESGALLLARTVNPELDAGACHENLDRIARRCRELISEPSSPREKCRVINRVLFHEWGFRGNQENYTDPRNSLLDQVLTTRKGIPISLSIIYLLVAERLGLELESVGIPGHFFVGCYYDDGVFFIDAFDRGVFRDPEDIFELMRANHLEPSAEDLTPTPVREVLCRCCRNLVNHYHTAGDPAKARMFAGFVEAFEAAYERNST
jgi:regulator of sirC expression with transglutaminase-like and TPR domain